MEVKGFRVLYVDSDEDATSLIKRIKKIPRNTCLVIHQNSKIFFNRKEVKKFRLLKEELNIELVFVTARDVFTRNILREGLQVYNSFTDFKEDKPLQPLTQKEKEDETDLKSKDIKNEVTNKMTKPVLNKNVISHKKQKRHRKKYILLAGSLICILFIGLAIILSFYPPVTVEIVPRGRYIEREFNCQAVMSGTEEEANGQLPLHNFRLRLSGSIEVPVLGREKVGIEKARGNLLLINETGSEVKIPGDTIVSTEDNVRFKILQDVIVPPVVVKEVMGVAVGMDKGQVRVEIEALEPGERGNVPPGAITRFVSDNFPVQIINPEATFGGKAREMTVVTEGDIERAKKELIESIKEKIIQRVYQELGSDFRVFADHIVYIPEDFNCLQKVGTEENNLEAEGSIEARGIIVRHQDLNNYLYQAFLPKLQEGQVISMENMNIKSLKLKKIEENKYILTVSVVARVYNRLPLRQIAQKLSGKSIEEVTNLLKEDQNIKDFRIFNNWGLKTFPPLSQAIKIRVAGGLQ